MKGRRNRLPVIPSILLRRIYVLSLHEGYSGDIGEEYRQIMDKEGRKRANLWLWTQAVKSIPGYIQYNFLGSIAMLKNYIKIAFRNIRKQKAYTIINISGLAIGMAVCILIMIWVRYEMDYEKFHENRDRIYRLILDADIGGQLRTTATMAPAAQSMIEQYPEVQNATRVGRLATVPVSFNNRRFQESRVGYADQSFFDIFSFPFYSATYHLVLHLLY